MGLAWDDTGKAQWSHLVEHLVIRSTDRVLSQEANAETLPDHMRLDYYGTVRNWQQGLSYHAEWLQGTPFSKESLEREKPKVNAESDFTARNLATHKFAMAAWAQAYRHGQSHASLKADVDQATLSDVQQYRDDRLVVLTKTVVCIIGGVDVEAVKPVVAEKLGAIASTGRLPDAEALAGRKSGITWDLPTRHLVSTWVIPDFDDADYAALYVAAALLQMRMFNDSSMKSLTGNVLAGADLTTPEGNFFFVNAVLQPGAEIDDARRAIEEQLLTLRKEESLTQAASFAKQLSFQLRHVTDPVLAKRQAPANVSLAMIEGNIGLQWGMKEFRYGPFRPALAGNLTTLTTQDVQKAIDKYLSIEKRHTLTIRPAAE